MAIVLTAIKNGERTDITGSELVTEYRCDGCGEFTAAADTVELRAILRPGPGPSSHATGHLHLGCLAERLPPLAAGLTPIPDPQPRVTVHQAPAAEDTSGEG